MVGTSKGRGCVETHLRACGYIRGYSAGTLVQRASHLVVDMPIGEGVVALLHGHLQPAEAAAALMGRESWGESV